jgi:hypothetical protein
MAENAYLDEASLGRFLRERLDPDVVADRAVPGLVQRFRPDYRSERHRLVIEFDGNQHYQRAAHVVGDERRDVVLAAAGYTTVRVPYFVQLTPETIPRLFGNRVTDVSAFKDFPHGFIADQVVFPADFCELGIKRFRLDLIRFVTVAPQIMASLDRAVDRCGDWRLIFPPSLRAG